MVQGIEAEAERLDPTGSIVLEHDVAGRGNAFGEAETLLGCHVYDRAAVPGVQVLKQRRAGFAVDGRARGGPGAQRVAA